MNTDTFKPLWIFLSKNWFNLLLIIASIVCLVWAGNLVTQPKQPPEVVGLASFILALATSFLSVVTTRMYAKFGFDETLRDHGVQIARGIRVLQDEMATLQDWVCQKRAWFGGSPRAAEHVDPALEHVEQTLRFCQNMTANALGGITGVIGDAVAQYEALMKEMSRVRVEASRETAEIEEEIETASSPEDVENLQQRKEQVARESAEKISQLVQTAGVLPPPEPPKQIFSPRCPYCLSKNTVEIPLRKGQTQVVTCGVCEKVFNTHLGAANRLVIRPLTRISLSGENFMSDVQKFLEVTHSYVPPSQFESLRATVAQYDGLTPERTPVALQAAIVRDNVLVGLGASHASLRTFVKLVKNGGGFSFEAGAIPTYKARYTNNLNRDWLLRAFLAGVVRMLSNVYALTTEHVEWLAKLLLPTELEEEGQKILGAIFTLSSGVPAGDSEKNKI